MTTISAVETNEVAAVEGHENSLPGDGEVQDFGVGNGSAGVAALERGHHVVSQSSQFLDHGEREVFVGIDPGHGLILKRSRSRRFVLRSRRDAPAQKPMRWPGPQLSRRDSTPATGLHWPRVAWPEPATRLGSVSAR